MEIITEVVAYQAKTHLSELLRKVKAGQRFRITVRGVPVAHLIPIHEESREKVREVVAQMKRFMRETPSLTVSSEELRGYRDEGRD